MLLALDISADLHELTRCPVGLVSSGVKSILDIKRLVVLLNCCTGCVNLTVVLEPLNTW